MRLKDEKFYKTVRDFLDIYLIRHRGYSLNTQKSYREAINLLLLYFKAERGLEYSNVGFEDITYSNITGFLEWLSKSRGCSPATVNLRLMAIRSFTKYAGILDSGKIYMQVEVGNISVRKTPGKVVEFLTAPALETLFEQPNRFKTNGCRDFCFMRLMYDTAARCQELVDVKIHDLSIQNPLLARAAAIAENENSSFAEALSLAAAERGTPLRRVFADEAEALSHDLGHGGAAEQRAVIDLDNGRIRLEYDHRAGSLRESLDALANHFPTAGANRIQNRLIAFLAEHDGSEELYKTLHNELGLTNQEIEAMGFDLAHRYEPDCDDAYQDIVDYIRFEQETSKMWPWLISGDEMLAQETTLREIAGRLTAAGEWDTESIYESLTEAFGNNLSLDKQSKDDTKEEERNINIKQDQLDLLWQLEEFRKKHEHQAEPSDWAIRMCEAFVARSMGFTDRVQWTELLRQKGETLFTFDWKSGSVSDHVVQWCKENNRNWRYSHLGELQVAHGGEWRKVDYFCRDGSETRVYFPPEPVQEQQLHALAEAPAVHLRDLLTLGLPDHDVYLVHAAEDVGWVPAADLPRLTAQGKEEFSALLDAKIAAIRPGPYGVELVLDGVNSQLLAQYDETLANSSRAEHAMELFL